MSRRGREIETVHLSTPFSASSKLTKEKSAVLVGQHLNIHSAVFYQVDGYCVLKVEFQPLSFSLLIPVYRVNVWPTYIFISSFSTSSGLRVR
jgi:hypothetical protein